MKTIKKEDPTIQIDGKLMSLGVGGTKIGAGRKSKETYQTTEEIYIEYKTAQAKKELHNANLAELEEQKARQELVHVDLVKQQAAQAAKIIKESLLALPSRLSAILANQSEPVVRERLTTELRKLLEDLSNEFK